MLGLTIFFPALLSIVLNCAKWRAALSVQAKRRHSGLLFIGCIICAISGMCCMKPLWHLLFSSAPKMIFFFFFLNVLVPWQTAKFLNCATHEIFYCSLNQSRTFVGGREAHWCRWASVLPVGMCVCVSLKCTHSTTAVASGNLAAVLLLLEVSQTCCVASPKPKHILWKCGDPQRKWDKEFPRKWSASAERGNRGCAIQECSTLCTISFCVMF